MKVHQDVTPGDGLTEAVHDACLAIMRCIVPTMFKAQQPWALMGSLASVLQGIPKYTPPDIDLVTTMEGAYTMQGCLGNSGATLRQVSHSSAGPYTSHFGIFEVQGVKVEVMGDLVIDCQDGSIDSREHFSRWSDKVRVLHFEDLHVPVVPLEWQLVANALLRRPERVGGIAEYLVQHGWDEPYLEALLADKHYGAETVRIVRESLRIG